VQPYLVTDPSLADKICERIARGATMLAAAASLDIDRTQVYRWINRGKLALEAVTGDDGPDLEAIPEPERCYADFARKLEVARARMETDLTGVLVDAAHGGQIIEQRTITRRGGETETVVRLTPPDTRAATFLLERRLPASYGRTVQRVELTTTTDAVPGVVREGRLADAIGAYLAGVAEARHGQQAAPPAS
jgi:hypothetical protein